MHTKVVYSWKMCTGQCIERLFIPRKGLLGSKGSQPPPGKVSRACHLFQVRPFPTLNNLNFLNCYFAGKFGFGYHFFFVASSHKEKLFRSVKSVENNNLCDDDPRFIINSTY